MIACKNCDTPLSENANFCNNCGAKIIKGDSSLKSVLGEFFMNAFGWDNKVFRTIKTLTLRPEKLFKEYLEGTRKRYMSPFTFLTLCAGLTFLTINQFSDKFIEITNQIQPNQPALLQVDNFKKDVTAMKKQGISADSIKAFKATKRLERQKEMLEMNEKIQNYTLKYMNIFTYFVLPLNALLFFLVFGKPYKYSQHLIVNAYIQGFLSLITTILFLMSLVISPMLYYINFVVGFGGYFYFYKRLYNYTPEQMVGKVFKYIGLYFLFGLVAAILTTVVIIGLYKMGVITM